MRLWCFQCHSTVSTEIPDDSIFRATATCPECMAKYLDRAVKEQFDILTCVATIAAGVAQRYYKADQQFISGSYGTAEGIAQTSWKIYDEIVRVQEERLSARNGGER